MFVEVFENFGLILSQNFWHLETGNSWPKPLLFKMETNTFFSNFFFQTHQKTTAVRSGDYYLFEDLDEKVELDLLHERPSAGIDDAITDRKLSDKMTIEQVNFFN